jgi:hypothetical protein
LVDLSTAIFRVADDSLEALLADVTAFARSKPSRQANDVRRSGSPRGGDLDPAFHHGNRVFLEVLNVPTHGGIALRCSVSKVVPYEVN